MDSDYRTIAGVYAVRAVLAMLGGAPVAGTLVTAILVAAATICLMALARNERKR